MAMNSLHGKVTVSNLPPHLGISATIAFFPVEKESSEAPYDGNPPGDLIKDFQEISDVVKFEGVIKDASREFAFSLQRPSGYYYLQLRFILYRVDKGKVYAQVEQFFFRRRPVALFEDIFEVNLPVKWPSIPLDELETYGTVKPKNR